MNIYSLKVTFNEPHEGNQKQYAMVFAKSQEEALEAARMTFDNIASIELEDEIVPDIPVDL